MNHVATNKLKDLLARGFVLNGVAFINPTTGERGLLDDLGAVYWTAPPRPIPTGYIGGPPISADDPELTA